MAALFEVVLPVFGLVGLGRLAAWRGLLTPGAIETLSTFIFRFALPPLLFRAVTTAGSLSFAPALPFMLVALAIFAAGTVLARRALGDGLAASGVFGLNCAFGNAVMMGVPVIAAAFGKQGVAELLAIIAFHSALLMPVATATVEAGLHARVAPGRIALATARSLSRNPIILAIGLGFAWTWLALPTPAALARTLDLLAGAAAPVALVALGASLPPAPRRADIAPVLLSCLLKNVLMPALVFAAARLAGLAPLAVAVSTLAAAMPTGANAFMLASRYATAAERSAAAVLVSTLVSLPVLGALLVAFRQP